MDIKMMEDMARIALLKADAHYVPTDPQQMSLHAAYKEESAAWLRYKQRRLAQR